MAGKGDKPRISDMKRFISNFPKTTRKIEGFVKIKNKFTKNPIFKFCIKSQNNCMQKQ